MVSKAPDQLAGGNRRCPAGRPRDRAARYREHADIPSIKPLTALERGRRRAHQLVAAERDCVLLHGDLHPGNVLVDERRGLVAIDPRPCIGAPAFDVVDWVFWNTAPDRWHAGSHDLARALDIEPARLWAWCSALAPILAASKIMRGATSTDVQALLAIEA